MQLGKLQPENFELETTTIWSFPKRGDWATHKGDYRGNWAPQIVRNLILKYSKEGDIVLDQMVGGGTTLIETKLLHRNGIGVDINPNAIKLAKDRLTFDVYNTSEKHRTKQELVVGDARNLYFLRNESIDLIATHPPYANIIVYNQENLKDDLSSISEINEFLDNMRKIAQECYRVLKSGKYCCILIGDTRKNKHYVPIAFKVMNEFLDCGFILKEDVIKKQWQCKSVDFWKNKSKDSNFLLIMHEHLFIFRKPYKNENIDKYRNSTKNLR